MYGGRTEAFSTEKGMSSPEQQESRGKDHSSAVASTTPASPPTVGGQGKGIILFFILVFIAMVSFVQLGYERKTTEPKQFDSIDPPPSASSLAGPYRNTTNKSSSSEAPLQQDSTTMYRKDIMKVRERNSTAAPKGALASNGEDRSQDSMTLPNSSVSSRKNARSTTAAKAGLGNNSTPSAVVATSSLARPTAAIGARRIQAGNSIDPMIQKLLVGIEQGKSYVVHDFSPDHDPVIRKLGRYAAGYADRLHLTTPLIINAIRYRHREFKAGNLKVFSENGTLVPAEEYPVAYYLMGLADETFSEWKLNPAQMKVLEEVLKAVKNLYLLDWNPNYQSDAGFLHVRTVPIPDLDILRADSRVLDWQAARLKGPYTVAFRGATTGISPPNVTGCGMIDRARMVKKFLHVPNTSVKFSNLVQGCALPKEYMGASMSHTDMARKAKVILDIDGNANAWSALRWKLSGGCVVKVASLFIQWHYQWLEHGKNVYMLDIDSPTFVEEVMALADDPDRCDAMSKLSREHSAAVSTKASAHKFLNEAVAHVVERYPDSLYEKPFVFSVRNYTWKPRILPTPSPSYAPDGSRASGSGP